MAPKTIGDPEKLVGELTKKESLWQTYGFEITDMVLTETSEEVEMFLLLLFFFIIFIIFNRNKPIKMTHFFKYRAP